MGGRVPALAFVLCTAVGCGAATHLGHPSSPRLHPVLTTGADEQGPAVGRNAFAWMQAQRADPVPRPPRSRTNVYLRLGSRVVRVNPVGSFGQTGGIDGTGLYLQLIQGNRSRLARYDLQRRRLALLPSWINDGTWLWRPDADRDRVLYGAITPGRAATLAYEIRLADLRHKRVQLLDRLDGHAEYAAPGQLRGDWATWVACPENTCNVWRKNLRTGAIESAPDPDSLVYTQIAPAVDDHGTVYFDRSLASCGKAQIMRWASDGTIHHMLNLPKQFAYQYGALSKNGKRLYIDLGPCTNEGDDIYAVALHQPSK